MKRIKVIHLIEDLNTGGAERISAGIVTGLDKKRFEAEVWCLEEGGAVAEEIARQGIPTKILGLSSYHNPLNILKLALLIKETKPDILHIHGYFAGTFVRLANFIARVPVVFSHLHSTHYYYQKKHLLTEKFLAKFTDRILCCSEAVKKWAQESEGIPAKQLVVVYNGIEVDRYQPNVEIGELRKRLHLTGEERIIGTVGRLEPVKNQTLLLEAASRVKEKVPNLKVILVGEGSLRASLLETAARLGLEEAVIFTGRTDQVARYLSLMEVFVLCSRLEGLAMVLLEAMAAGKPVISTRVGGIPEVIGDEVTGLLVPPGDAKALSEAIIYLLTHPEEAKRMGDEGRVLCQEKFSTETMVKRIEELYESALG